MTNNFKAPKQQKQLGLLRVEGFTGRPDANPFHVNMVVIGIGQGGGRIADEFSRIGYTAYAVNSSHADLADLSGVKPENRIHLEGFEGAAKNIAIGATAVMENGEMLTALLERPEIQNADFVWLCASFGGGTGNGGFPLMAEVLSDMRSEKRTLEGKPTVGGIITFPAKFEKLDSKLNAMAGFQKIKELQASNTLGACLIVDNDKLAADYYEFQGAAELGYRDWMVYGNTLIAASLYEMASVTSLPGSKVFDRAEFLDVVSTPGYLTIGKHRITHDIEHITTWENIIKDAFEHSELASGYNFESDSKVGCIITLHKPYGAIDDRTLLGIEKQASTYLESSERLHVGQVANKTWEVIPDRFNHIVPLASGLIYTMTVLTGNDPLRVRELQKEILDEQENKAKRERERLAQLQQNENTLQLGNRFQLAKPAVNDKSTATGNAFKNKAAGKFGVNHEPAERFRIPSGNLDEDVELS